MIQVPGTKVPHDELCPLAPHPAADSGHCGCSVIARARADERERIATAIDMARASYCQTAYGSVNGNSSIAIAYKHAARIARQGGSDD